MDARPMLAFGGFRRGGSSVGFMILQHLLIESGLRSADPVKALWDRGIPTSRITARQLAPEWDRMEDGLPPPRQPDAQARCVQRLRLVFDTRQQAAASSSFPLEGRTVLAEYLVAWYMP